MSPSFYPLERVSEEHCTLCKKDAILRPISKKEADNIEAFLQTQLDSITALLAAYPLAGTWYISKYSDSLFTVVNNDGTAAMEFDVIFTAATEVTDPEFYHVERGTFIKINKVMAAGEKITVSTVYGRKGVTLQLPDGTQANGFKYLDVGSDLNMQMAPGTNTIRCDAANNREGLRVQVIMPKGVVPGI